MLIMLAGGPANTSWIAGAAGARDACRSGGLANTSWIAGAADCHDACNTDWIAGAADARDACRWPCQCKLDCWGG